MFRARVALAAFVLGALLAVSASASASASASSGPVGCDGTPNLQPIYSAEPTFVRSVPNGVLYQTGGDDVQPNVLVGHVYGTAYEMGFAIGQLLQPEISTLYPQMYDYIYNQVNIKGLPQWLQEIIKEVGVQAALQATYDLTKPFIPQRFIDEAQGIADALNMTFDDVMRLNLFPELIQASCSMMGAKGDAVKMTNATLTQLRALDWGTDSPLNQFPLIMVYHPSQEGHAFSTLTWAGMMGAITGYSSADVAICEKVWDSYTGHQNRAGMPWMFVLRDILQFDMTIDDALNRIYNTTRTCSIWVGIGDGSPNFNVVQYSFEEVNVFNDMNMPNHTNFEDIVYVDKHVQPSSDPCMPSLLQEYYGQLDPVTTLRQVTSQFQTGNMHIAVWDHGSRIMFASNAAVVNSTGPQNAFDRPFVMVDLNQLFAQQPPAVLPAQP